MIQWLRIHLTMQGTLVWSLVQDDRTCCRATKPLHHNCQACAPGPKSCNCWSPCITEPMLCNKGSLCNEKPAVSTTRESLRTATKTQQPKKKINNKCYIEYQESNLNYRFIEVGESHSLSPLCIICDDWLSNKVSKPSKLLYHRKTKHPAIKCKSLEFSKGKKKVNTKNRRNYWRPPLHQMCLHWEHHS